MTTDRNRTVTRRFGSRLRRLRQSQGLTQERLAERAGVSPDSVRRIETGRTNPSLVFLSDLARGLGVTVAELVGDGPSPSTQAADGSGRILEREIRLALARAEARSRIEWGDD